MSNNCAANAVKTRRCGKTVPNMMHSPQDCSNNSQYKTHHIGLRWKKKLYFCERNIRFQTENWSDFNRFFSSLFSLAQLLNAWELKSKKFPFFCENKFSLRMSFRKCNFLFYFNYLVEWNQHNWCPICRVCWNCVLWGRRYRKWYQCWKWIVCFKMNIRKQSCCVKGRVKKVRTV